MIVFLKSTDDTMLDTLQKMSGVTHKTFIDGKTVNMDHGQVFMQLSNSVSYNVSTTEVPVISYNDMAFISERNSMVFRAGDSPIWNRNETILPMSWRLFKNTIVHPGHEYSLQTIPTLSSALDFDVRKNQPDFEKMLAKRMAQAAVAQDAQDLYKKVYKKDDTEIARLDPDEYADEVMLIINSMVEKSGKNLDGVGDTTENKEVVDAVKENMEKQDARQEKIYAEGSLSADDLVSMSGQVNHQYDKEIVQAFVNERGSFEKDHKYFKFEHECLFGVDSSLYIEKINASKDYKAMDEASKSANTNVFAEGSSTEKDLTVINSYRVHDDFYKFLVSPACQQGWKFAGGRFEQQMAKLMYKDS